jgi:hypothetical protein
MQAELDGLCWRVSLHAKAMHCYWLALTIAGLEIHHE